MDNSQLLSSPAAAAEAPGSPWALHLGPFSVGSDGLSVKPQFKVGGQFGCVRADYGIGDVREGLKLDLGLSAETVLSAQGQSVAELHEGVGHALCEKAAEARQAAEAWGPASAYISRSCSPDCDSAALKQALGTAASILGTAPSAAEAGSQVTRIAAACGLGVDSLRRALEEEPPSPMCLRVTAYTGFGINMKLCLGWEDPAGYRMVGVGTKVATGIAVGGDVFAGKHASGASIKIMLGLGNFLFEYTLPIRAEAAAPAKESSPSEAGAKDAPSSSLTGPAGEEELPKEAANAKGSSAEGSAAGAAAAS